MAFAAPVAAVADATIGIIPGRLIIICAKPDTTLKVGVSVSIATMLCGTYHEGVDHPTAHRHRSDLALLHSRLLLRHALPCGHSRRGHERLPHGHDPATGALGEAKRHFWHFRARGGPAPTDYGCSRLLGRRTTPCGIRSMSQRCPQGEFRAAAYKTPPADPAAHVVQPLQITGAIPGSTAPLLRLPPVRPGTSLEQRRSEIEALFADLEIVAPSPEPVPAPGQAPLTLANLQAIAVSHNPLIRQAASDVESARGDHDSGGGVPQPALRLPSR